MDKMKRTKNILGITVIFMVSFFLLSCNRVETDSQSNSQLIVLGIEGKDFEGGAADYLQSDVIVGTTIFADVATASLTVKLLNPAPLSLLGASQYNAITVRRYVVTYLLLSDPDNPDYRTSVPGVDTPYSFEASMSILIDVGAAVDISFIIVREVAKAEPPLLALYDSGGEGVLEVKARVDFYGQDIAENWVEATGWLTIFFANYADK
jgi:hypothetical protein